MYEGAGVMLTINYAGEKKLCLMINGEVFEALVARISENMSYHMGELQALNITHQNMCD